MTEKAMCSSYATASADLSDGGDKDDSEGKGGR